MFDMSWGEVMVIGAVALIVIGPKDLPKALRTVGNMVSKIRRMAGEFQGQFNEALREAELDDVKRQLQGMNDAVSKGFNPVQTIRDELKGAIDGPAPTAKASEPAAPPSEDPPALSLGLPELPSVIEPVAAVATAVERDLEPAISKETQAPAASEKP
jgi:sec-independent protein translocase protein TatB